jgi:hypothetical protein
VQGEAQQVKQGKHWKRVPILGLDGAHVLGWGEKQPVWVAVDIGTGEPIAVGYINEYDPQAVRRWLEPLIQRHGIRVIVTDDLSSYKIVAEKLHLGHQVCQFHVRRQVGKTLKQLQETLPKKWSGLLDEIHQLLDRVPPDGSQTLFALWKSLPRRRSLPSQVCSALEQLRNWLLRLSDPWQSYCTFQSEPEVPWPNNSTQRAIGRMKMRARTVRGYISWPVMQSGFFLAGTYTA